MTPVDEMEQIVKEIAVYDKIDYTKSYTIKSFPEIFFMKYTFCYKVEMLEDYRQSDDVIKRYEEFANEVKNKKITIENKFLDRDRNFYFYRNNLMTHVPIYYKDCIFISPYGDYGDIGKNCENCIVEKDET